MDCFLYMADMMMSLDDCFAVLSIKGKGLSAEAKYFLIRVLLSMGVPLLMPLF